MADIKISALPSVTTVTPSTDVLPLVSGGVTTKATPDNIVSASIASNNIWKYAPAPTSISAVTTLTAVQLKTNIINTTGSTYTVTLPTGTEIDAEFTNISLFDIGFDFNVINTASGVITMAINTGVTSVGTLTIASGVSASFRLRRTAVNTYVLYRLS